MTNDGHQAAMALVAFLDVTELVEHTLFQLPVKDMLLAQRVSKAWHTTITSSPDIQRALFCRPSEDILLKFKDCLNRGLACLNRFSCPDDYDDTPNSGLEEEMYTNRWVITTGEEWKYEPKINPFIGCRGFFDFLHDVNTSLHRPEASWRKMLLTQPPIHNILVDHGLARHWHILRAKAGSDGLTLQDLHENAIAHCGDCFIIHGIAKVQFP